MISPTFVMARPDRAIHALRQTNRHMDSFPTAPAEAWMAGSSPAMTRRVKEVSYKMLSYRPFQSKLSFVIN
jgi:hypothetical protein